jgi:hypothetical protein
MPFADSYGVESIKTHTTARAGDREAGAKTAKYSYKAKSY